MIQSMAPAQSLPQHVQPMVRFARSTARQRAARRVRCQVCHRAVLGVAAVEGKIYFYTLNQRHIRLAATSHRICNPMLT